MATWGDFVDSRLPQHMRDHIRASEAAEQRAWEAEQVERADRLDTARRMSEVQEAAVVYRTGHSSSEWREIAGNIAAARESRDQLAEYGSASRQAILIDGKEIPPREQVRPGPWVKDPEAAQLARARASQERSRPFMEAEIARFNQRQRDGGKPVISRSSDVRCIECSEADLDEEQSYFLHHDPSFGPPIPEVVVPDHAPSRSRRPGPAKVPMIYR
jgi:hypothetical protein